MSLGEKIREERKKAGLSQEQLAEKLNESSRYLYTMYTGGRRL